MLTGKYKALAYIDCVIPTSGLTKTRTDYSYLKVELVLQGWSSLSLEQWVDQFLKFE